MVETVGYPAGPMFRSLLDVVSADQHDRGYEARFKQIGLDRLLSEFKENHIGSPSHPGKDPRSGGLYFVQLIFTSAAG